MTVWVIFYAAVMCWFAGVGIMIGVLGMSSKDNLIWVQGRNIVVQSPLWPFMIVSMIVQYVLAARKEGQ